MGNRSVNIRDPALPRVLDPNLKHPVPIKGLPVQFKELRLQGQEKLALLRVQRILSARNRFNGLAALSNRRSR